MTGADYEQQQAHHLIAAIVRETGLTPSEIARKAGLAPSTVTRIYPIASGGHMLSMRTLAKLRSAFPLAQGGGAPSLPAADWPGAAGLQLSLVRSVGAGGLQQGYAGLDMFELVEEQSGGPRDRVAAFDPKRHLAIYMPGTSMAPRIKAGEALIADKRRPPALDSDVILLIRRDDQKNVVCVGRLVGRDGSAVTIGNFHAPDHYRIPIDDIVDIHPIVAILDARVCD